MSGVRPTYDELREDNQRLARENAELRGELEKLRALVEELRRAGKRQAAPFSKGPPKAQPKRPGRKPGHQPSHRPAPAQIDRTIVVPLPADCPAWGTPLAAAPVVVHEQFQVDLPEPNPITTRFRVPVARCPKCGRRVQGRHPEQTSDALGAAAVQLGPRLLALGADLKHRLGLSYRKIASLVVTLTGLTTGYAAFCRSGHRLRRLGQVSYDALIAAARRSPAQHIDETGWKIGGHSAWLWVFADDRTTIYRIRQSRGHDVVVETLGDDFAGVVVSDCFLAYDPLVGPKQKCLAHLLRACGTLEALKTRGAIRFSRRVAALLRKAMALKRRRDRMTPYGYYLACHRLHRELDRLLAGTYTDPDNARLAKRLRKQRPHLLRFLKHDGLDATNNLAERELRPAVIARKLSAGNRTEAGAETHAVLASLLQTCRRRGHDILQMLGELLRHGPGHIVDLLNATPPNPTR
jgi:transposase